MPRMVRAMRASGSSPLIGSTASTLGVRVPADIAPDSDGIVVPGGGGMSVAPRLEDLPVHRVPKRLRSRRAGAIGSTTCFVWAHAEGPFPGAPTAPPLRLRPDRPTHGVVEPDTRMPFARYEQAIHATRDGWILDEGL